MNKEFIPYEQALALKELGFDEPCFRFYSEKYAIDSKTGGDIKTGEFYLTDRPKTKTMRCSAPLFSQTFRFFREKHRLYHSIDPLGFSMCLGKVGELGSLLSCNTPNYGIYEEAELACLKMLIEIVKEKNELQILSDTKTIK